MDQNWRKHKNMFGQ